MKMMLLISIAAYLLQIYRSQSFAVAATFAPVPGKLVKNPTAVPTVEGIFKNKNDFQQRLHSPLRNNKIQRYFQLNAVTGKVGIKDVFRNIWRRRHRTSLLSKQCNNIPRGGSKFRACRPKRGGSRNGPKPRSGNIRMYLACLLVVLAWITTGTLFYSKFNNWPLPQSFFYAVDAGMSIGFCTDVAETKIGSRAFTIVFILLGASCVGGALVLFVKDIMEGVADFRRDKFDQLLAAHAVKRVDTENTGKLTYPQFRTLVEEWSNLIVSDGEFDKLCRRFDPLNEGKIPSELFVKKCHEMDTLLHTSGPLYSERFLVRKAAQVWIYLKGSFSVTYRIFPVFIIWIITGVWWGHKRQGWDLITATHFAVSALATGGLTGPDVNADGILPTEPALFCGIYCLFGIPLFALTLGHFARVLVEGYVSAVEEKAVLESIRQPLDITEFEYAKNLCSSDKYIHLSDFIVLQLLRQGKVTTRDVNLMKSQYELLDTRCSGRITSDEACRYLEDIEE